MNYLWGSIMIITGFYLAYSGTKKSNGFVYRLLVSRAEIIWGKHVHLFFIAVGIIIASLSSLFYLGLWG